MERLKNFVCRDGFAEVNTNAGRIRGFMENDVYTFLGIPYGKAKRFKKAEPDSPWKGTLTATTYGYTCPNMDDNFLPDEIMGMPRLWHSSEDCLNLNIWTTSLDKEAQKPVMVFLHGGGYFSGSAIHLTCYEGKEQALLGDVVSVTVNHRLNVLGFLDLSQYGDDFRESGNVGILDLVEALKWVQENIASFGGNPDNVTIYGHSGGGGKVTTLMQMPCADGLYHKAIIMSGITRMEGPVDGLPMRITRETAQKNARILVNAAGGTDKLQSMPVNELMALVPHTFKDYFFWSPVPGAGDYPGDPGQAGIREETGNIPVMIGNALCEFSGPADSRDKSQVTEGEVVKKLSEKYGLKGPALYDIYKKTYPNLKPYYALTLIPMAFRQDVNLFSEKRADLSGAPVYEYLLAYESAYNGGTISWHGVELPFVFHNAEDKGCVFSGEQTWVTQEEIFNAWIHFAKYGNPNHDLLPKWDPFTREHRACMVFGAPSACRVNHDEELLSIINELKG